MQATNDGLHSKTRLDIYLATSLKSRQINFGPQMLFKRCSVKHEIHYSGSTYTHVHISRIQNTLQIYGSNLWLMANTLSFIAALSSMKL